MAGTAASSINRPNSNVDLDTHITVIVNVFVSSVGHSYGGMVSTGVADRARDRVSRLIYIDAFVADNGQTLFDLGLRLSIAFDP